MNNEKIVIIGSGAAGINAARAIRTLCGPTGEKADIVLVSKDGFAGSRVLITDYTAGTRTEAGLSFVDDSFFNAYGITTIFKTEVLSIDRERHTVCTKGKEIPYSKLIVACGGNPFIPPINGLDIHHSIVSAFFNKNDAETLLAEVGKKKQFMILGGGPIGLDAAFALLKNGEKVTVIEGAQHILPKQADSYASSVLKKKLQSMGAEIIEQSFVSECNLGEKSGTITLDNGKRLPFQRLIVAAGSRSNNEIMKKAGIVGSEQSKGIKTNDPDVFLAGDASGYTSTWKDAAEQGIGAAKLACGLQLESDERAVPCTSIHFDDFRMISAGQVCEGQDDFVKIVKENNTYRKFIFHGDRLIGLLFLGDVRYSGLYKEIIEKEIAVPESIIENPGQVFQLEDRIIRNRKHWLLSNE